MQKKKKIAHLSIFLVKESYKNANEIVKEEDCKAPIEIPISGSGKGKLYLKHSNEDYPKWSSFFEDNATREAIGKVYSVSAAFLLQVSTRFFILTFGQGGRFLIREDVCEDRFGLLVALNSVDKESFRCIDKQSLDAIQSRTRIQSGQESNADQFGLDVEQDMIKAIVGKPEDSTLGSLMAGTDSLSVSVTVNLANLSSLLDAYKEKFEKDLSSTDYQWVNNISLVKNSATVINELNGLLEKKFSIKDYTNIWLAIPDIIQWDSVKGFIYTNGRRLLNPDINLDGFLKTVDDTKPITLNLLKNRYVYCADENHDPIFNKKWSVYKCLYAEIDFNGNKYILNDSNWFCVNKDFVTKTNNDFKNIELSQLKLPEYSGGGEGAYNSGVVSNYPNEFALLDDKNKIFHGGGKGQVEACDLFSKKNSLSI